MEIKFEKLSLGVYSSEHLQKHQEFSEESLLVGNTIRENSSGEEYFEELAKLLGNRTYDLSKNFEFGFFLISRGILFTIILHISGGVKTS